MTSDRKKPGVAFWATVALVVAGLLIWLAVNAMQPAPEFIFGAPPG
jgi:hypothetical protein